MKCVAGACARLILAKRRWARIITSAALIAALSIAAQDGNAEPDPDKPALEWLHSRPAGVEFTRTEITVDQFKKCIAAGACIRAHYRSVSGEWPEDNAVARAKNKAECNLGHEDRGQHPINCVTEAGAEEFCRWVGGRVPTVKEWDAEAFDGGKRKHPWGDQKPTCDLAVLKDKGGDGCGGGVRWSMACEKALLKERGGEGCGRGGTWPVGSKPAGNSVSGLADMFGNVEEWTSSTGPELPQGVIWHGERAHYARGGNYNLPLLDEFSPYPLWTSDVRVTGPSGGTGFRCIRSPHSGVEPGK